MKIYVIWIILFARFLTVCGQVNIAAGGVTSQTLDLDWAGYLWTSDKAVDGCDTAAISANFSSAYTASRCCSCSNGGAGQQTWTVKLTTPSVLSTIVIEGRTDIAIQLTGFTVEIQPVSGDPPIQIYDNAVTGDQVTRPIRIENLATKFPIVIERVNVKRPQGPLTLCEVKVFSGLICHCLDKKHCDQQECSSCEQDWAGPTCQIRTGKLDIQPSFATQSPTINKAGLAVDGDNVTFSWAQDITDTTGFVSWTLDLQSSRNIYEVQIMFLQSTVDGDIKRRPGFSVAISDQDDPDYYSVDMCHRDNSASGENIGNVSLKDCAGKAQYVHIFNFRNESLGSLATWSKYPNLQLAEVVVIEDTGCADGAYGEKCDKLCGICKDAKCDRWNGTCLVCPDGWYGTQCNQTCGKCIGGTCERNYGTCSGSCDEGWFGTKCESPCSQFCMDGCKKGDGECNRCPPRRNGTQCELCPQCKGHYCHPNDTCKIACADPTMHGDDCNIDCNFSITGCIECQSVTGFVSCTKCVVGKYIDKCLGCPTNCVECVCENNCTVCKPGYAGLDCSNECSKPNCIECRPNGNCKICTRGFFVNGINCVNCSAANERCLSCSSPFDCEECIPGYYLQDRKCNKCPVNCKECESDKRCSKCEAEWQGLTCKCGQNCKQDRVMQVSDWCSQENGTCLKGCVAGKWTSDCKTDCPPLDGTCLICDQTDGKCFECVPGRYGNNYYGHQFNSSCSEKCGQCADGKCQIDNGACSGQCNPGNHGANCSLSCSENCKNGSCEKDTGKCYECKTGFYGDQCDMECNTNCKLDQTSCGQKDGFCDSCLMGFFGNQCDQNCSINCNLGQRGCSKEDGFCDVCKIGFYDDTCSSKCKNCMNSCRKTDGRCDECEIGFHGDNCKFKCPENCLNKCSRNTSHCIVCTKMFYGNSCENSCPDNCGEMGVQQNLCNKDTGFCQQCKAGYYGNKCEDRCSDQCAKNFMGLICEQADGRCRDCPVGMYGKFCDLPCAGKCVNPSKRHSIGDCHQMTSECVHGCQEGYHSNLCNMSCNTRCKGQQCDIDTAKCLNGCEEGFNGEYCSQEMPKSGVIIGVVVALIVLIMIIAVVIFIICRRKK
ncbi:multiple epidermal growth factor-like domains protein 6 [Dreissena polymorpha]|uniref:multiple epidermal growth factor-like domains protein 6 n=1 Tax=Dreissena polymorpha TaxID=45954 RepID=UPI002265202C|nr:multiple epidermal growth factor-like domains protein 6 [Dreissena polymorpha]